MLLSSLAAWCYVRQGFPGGTSGKEPAHQHSRHKRNGFHPWIGKTPWRRAWQPTPVFLPGESCGQRILSRYDPKGRKESDTTEATEQHSTMSSLDTLLFIVHELVLASAGNLLEKRDLSKAHALTELESHSLTSL